MAIQDDKPHDPVDEVKEDTSGQQLEDARHSAEKPVVAPEGAERITFKTWVVIFVRPIASYAHRVETNNLLDLVGHLWS